MKKFIFAFIFATMLTMSIASCNCQANNNGTAADSTGVDTVLIDSTAIDSIEAVDTVAIDSIVAE